MLFLFATNCFAWGKQGHRIVAQIAQNHLSDNAKLWVSELLDNDSLARVSNYADEGRGERTIPKWAMFHGVKVHFENDKLIREHNKKGDIYDAIKKCRRF